MDQDCDKQWPGLPIKDLIWYTKDFIVFIDNNVDVDWKTSDEYDRQGHKDVEKHNEIMNGAATIESIPSDHLSLRACTKRVA